MQIEIKRLWPLFFGIFVIGLCAGIQGTLLGIRAIMEGFDTRFTGLIMSGYFLGFIFGALQAPRVIRRVGHVRTFGALAALASTTVILHPIVIEPWTWFFLRVLSGFAFSTMYVVAESWLNQAAGAHNRGQILSLYAIASFSGMGAGQLLLNLAEPGSYEIFTMVSVLVSLAAIPMLITATPTPKPSIERFSRISIRKLFSWAPMGLTSVFLVQIGAAVLIGMGAVYARSINMSVEDISLFMASMIFGGIVVQWPLGRLSDRMDRRKVIAIVALIAADIAATLAYIRPENFLVLLILSALLGGVIFPLYAISIALVNDFMKPEKIVAASGTVALCAGIGSTLGPFMVSMVMEKFGIDSFFWFVSGTFLLLGALGAHRILTHKYVPQEDKHEFSIYAPAPVGTLLHAELEHGKSGDTADINDLGDDLPDNQANP